MCSYNLLQKTFFKTSLIKKVRLAGLFGVCGATFLCTTALANSSALSVSTRSSNNTFTEYGEKDFVWNEETGEIDHLGAMLHWQLQSGVFFEIAAERGKGTVDYLGYNQLMQLIQRQTEHLVTTQSLHLGRDFGKHSVYIGIGNSYRERNIVEGNLYEELNWRFGIFGMGKQFRFGQRWQLNLKGQLSIALDSQLKAEFAGIYDPIEIDPGQIASGYGGVELQYKITPKFSLSIEPRYDFTLITKGDQYPIYQNGEETGVSHHPKTEFEAVSWQLRISKHF